MVPEELLRKARSQGVRLLAVDLVTDEDLLFEVALRDPDVAVQRRAAKKIKDEDLLARLVLEATDRAVQSRAFSGVARVDLLTRIAESSSRESFRKRATRAVTNQEVLARIVEEDSSKWVREAAAKRLSDEEILARVAQVDSEDRVRRAALERIHRADLLVEIFESRTDTSDRLEVLARIHDQDVIQRIVSHEKDPRVRNQAIQRLNDPRLLAQLARSDADRESRGWALSRLGEIDTGSLADSLLELRDLSWGDPTAPLEGDPVALQRVASGARYWALRACAARRLTDREARLQTLANEHHPGARHMIIESVTLDTDLIALQKFAYYAADREHAWERIGDQEIPKPGPSTVELATTVEGLVDQVLTASHDYVAAAAVEQLHDTAALQRVGTQARDPHVLRVVLDRISDVSVLQVLASTATAPEMRIAASVRIGATTWPALAAATVATDANLETWEALEATARLFPKEGAVHAMLRDVGREWIRQGANHRRSELYRLLYSDSADQQFVEDCYHCGDGVLRNLAELQAEARGLELAESVAPHVVWGSADTR